MQPSPRPADQATPETPAPTARVFVGLKVAPEIAQQLADLAAPLTHVVTAPAGTTVRLIPPGDIHLTLVPPWNEASIPDEIARLGDLTPGFESFWLEFELVCYGPQRRRPRLLWVECARNDELDRLQAALMTEHGQVNERPFRPHVTIARIRGKGGSIAREHPMDLKLSLRQQIETVELFQSPPPGERGYRVLASMALRGGAA